MRQGRSDTLDRVRFEQLKRMLDDRRRDIQDRLRSIREALPRENADVRDTEEQSVDDFVLEIDFALMQMKSETLRRIDEALLRLEGGSYGQCLECAGEIAAGRLRALPFAERCRDCQEQRELAAHEVRQATVRASRASEQTAR